MTLIKSISGIRGTIGGAIGENLTPIDVVKFTAAYARFIAESYGKDKITIVVGRDARLSGQMVADLIEGTLIGCGADVIDLGLCTTPGTELAVTAYNADGGIIITASHNPKQWNALKLLNAKGEFLNDTEGKRVLAIAAEDAYNFVEIDSIGKVILRTNFDQAHIDSVLGLNLVDVEAVKAKKFKVVVDAVNSVGGVVIPELLRQMGAEVICLNCTPDGNFAHNPEPIPANLTEISEAVRANGADLGVVVDPDVDRLALVCEDGSMFGEEYTLVAVADYVLSKTPGNTVSNLSSSRTLRDVTVSRGGEYSAAAVGEVNVTTEMKRTGAIIGGEGNGGIIYPESHYGRDALVGVALFLTLLAERGVSMTELKASYPQYEISKNRIDLTPDIDGVKIDFPTEWVHLRKSNTEPIIRIYSESATMEAADALAERIMADIKQICNL